MRSQDELQWAHDLLISLLAADPSMSEEFVPIELSDVPKKHVWLHQLRRRILFSADAICWALQHPNPTFAGLLKTIEGRVEKLGEDFPENPAADEKRVQ